MTLFAGIIARRPGGRLAEGPRAELLALLSRHPEERPEVRAGEGWMLVKVDIGAYGSPGLYEGSAGALSLLAGDPLLDGGLGRRETDLASLHQAWAAGKEPALAQAQGSFCLAQFDPQNWRLQLAADKVGVRPIYYWIGADWIVFSTVFRVLEGLSLVERRMDLRGAVEKACFGFPLGERSVFESVRTIGAGERVDVSPSDCSVQRYWRWDQLPAPGLEQSELDRQLYERFKDAVRRRLRGDRVALSFLSGGLDSRAIVAALRDVGTHVHTLNFAPEGTQDELFGAEIAKRLGTRHLALPQRSETFGEQQRKLVGLWEDTLQPGESRPEHPRLAWSGDGGSVGVGHVYLSPELVRCAREDGVAAVAQAFVERHKLAVPTFVLRQSSTAELVDLPLRGVIEELQAQQCADPGRALHLFLMHNDQRRHLSEHFENIDLRRVELHLPFFDGRFLELILASPIDDFLRHRFYNRWLEQFPAATREVPWQSYPGHEPCPLPVPPGLRYQWRDVFSSEVVAEHRRQWIAIGQDLLAGDAFPERHIDRLRFRFALWVMRLGLRDTSHIVRFVKPLVESYRHAQRVGA